MSQLLAQVSPADTGHPDRNRLRGWFIMDLPKARLNYLLDRHHYFKQQSLEMIDLAEMQFHSNDLPFSLYPPNEGLAALYRQFSPLTPDATVLAVVLPDDVTVRASTDDVDADSVSLLPDCRVTECNLVLNSDYVWWQLAIQVPNVVLETGDLPVRILLELATGKLDPGPRRG